MSRVGEETERRQDSCPRGWKGKRLGSIRPSPGAARRPAGKFPYGQEWLLEASWVVRQGHWTHRSFDLLRCYLPGM